MSKSKKSSMHKTDNKPQEKVVEYKAPVSKSDDVTVDLQPFLVPISILLSGILIAGSIFFSLRNLTLDGVNTTTTTTTTTGTTDPGIDTGNEDPYPPAATSIDNDPIRGDIDSAKIAIVEFSDFECPFCQRFHNDTLDSIIDNYVRSGDAIYVFRDFPLSFHEPKASEAALAAECVNDIAGADKYYEFSDLYFQKTASNGQGIAGETNSDLAASIGVNVSEFEKCVSENRFADEIEADQQDGANAGVTGTPGFIIGILDDDGNVDGVSVPGAQPYSVFETIINEQLER